jgi:hypothetical protein
MKVFQTLLIGIALLSTSALQIPNKKICRDCKHFIANDWECAKFKDVNIITGKETFDSARSVRNNEKKCGDDANYFEENQYKIVTVPYYFLKEYWIFTPIIGLSAFYFYKLAEFFHW